MQIFRTILAPRNALMWLLACTASCHAVAQASSSTCQALIRVKNDLWFAKPDGSMVTQLTKDGTNKFAVAMSPNGSVIAYSGKNPPADVSLIDPTGAALMDVDLHAQDAIIGLKWTSSNMLVASQHVSPTNVQSFILNVPTSPFTPSVQVLSSGQLEGNCAMSPNEHDTACLQGDALVINSKTVYFLASPFAQATTLQTVTLAPGATIDTGTNPSFKITVQSIDNNSAALSITTSDGQVQQSTIADGDVYPITFPNPTASIYGARVSLSPNAKTITLSVLVNSQGNSSFEAGPIWDGSGGRVAFVEVDAAKQRWLMLVNKNLGNADQNGRGQGGIDGHELLPIAGPINSISFASDTSIMVAGQNQVLTQNIPAYGKVPANTPYSLSAAMPTQLTVIMGGAPTIVPVVGWKCQ